MILCGDPMYIISLKLVRIWNMGINLLMPLSIFGLLLSLFSRNLLILNDFVWKFMSHESVKKYERSAYTFIYALKDILNVTSSIFTKTHNCSTKFCR